VHVVIGNPDIEVTNPPEVAYPATVDLSLTFPHTPGLSYSYYADAALSVPVLNYQNIDESGTYYIKALDNKTGCTSKAPVVVKIGPPPPPVVKAVNTFTPNGDGINDLFSISITGMAEFRSLKIFSRGGQLVFQTNSQSVPWDGKTNGKPLPSGTYYWLFEGVNSYYKTKISQAGFITLLR
jgi:gliding motility-associated-like protein